MSRGVTQETRFLNEGGLGLALGTTAGENASKFYPPASLQVLKASFLRGAL